jgi:hypothetical protein
MKKLILLFICFVSLVSQSALANNYEIDHAAFDPLFEEAVEIDYNGIQELLKSDINAGLKIEGAKYSSNPHLTAAIAASAGMCLVLGFIIPVHRIILGTSPGVIIVYVCTLGGCGWITLVDTILLFLHWDDERYVGSQRWIMW